MAIKTERKPSEALWKLLRDAAFASLRDDFTARGAECSLSLSQGKLVRELAQPQSQRELARRLHYDPSNITALADSLESRGLIERRADASDRRVWLPALTPGGERPRLSPQERRGPPPQFLHPPTPPRPKEPPPLLFHNFHTQRPPPPLPR